MDGTTTESDGPTGPGRGPGRRRRLLLGAGILVGVFLFVWLRLDWRAVLDVVSSAELVFLAAGIVAALASIGCWSEALRHLLPPDAAAVSRRRGFLVYATGALVRNVIPLGYASSIVVLGYVYGREANTSGDRSLAAVSVAEFSNAVASTGMTVAGVLLLVTVGPSSPLVGWLALGTAVFVAGATAVTTALWYRREAVERVFRSVASLLASGADRLADQSEAVPSPDAVEAAMAGYYRSLSTVSAQRRSVGVALGYSLLAWSGFAASLYLCGLAVGVRIPLPVAMVMVSLAGYATVLPVPGGLGGYELGVAGGITILGGIDVVTALAATLLFRVCSYWFVVVVGLVASVALSVDVRRLVATARGPDRAEPGSTDR